MKDQYEEEEEQEEELEALETPEVEVPEVDLDAAADTVSGEQLRRLSTPAELNRPDISRLPDALEWGRPVFKSGDKIVIERYATILEGRPYLDTKTYRVIEMDDVSGRMRLYDETLCQFASDNWRTGAAAGSVYKLAMGVVVGTKKRRGRPRKSPVEAPAPAPPPPVKNPDERRGRGRPKGTKNRPKEEIKAEKAEKRAAASLRAARKNVKPVKG